MPLELTQISRQYVSVGLTVTQRNGSTGFLQVDSVGFAVLGERENPTAATTWSYASYDGREATVLLAGVGADPAGALVAPIGRSVLWLQVLDLDEAEQQPVAVIDVAA